MSFRHVTLFEPKSGYGVDEYEDAFWPPSRESGANRFAVADGATESSYSRGWAELLVEAYGMGLPGNSLGRSLATLRSQWRDAHPVAGLPWYAEQKLALGAFAALLGVRVNLLGKERRATAIAVGDCCLAHLRGEEFCCSFPMTAASDFGLHPELLGSVVTDGREVPNFRRRRIRVGSDDRLFLMTDAIAQWFLNERELGNAPWREIEDQAVRDFKRWVQRCREDRRMHDDDVTLTVVYLG